MHIIRITGLAIAVGFLLAGCATRGHTLEEVKDSVAAAARPAPLPPLAADQRKCADEPAELVVIVHPDGTRTYPMESAVGAYIEDLRTAGADCRTKHGSVVRSYDAAEARSRALPPSQ